MKLIALSKTVQAPLRKSDKSSLTALCQGYGDVSNAGIDIRCGATLHRRVCHATTTGTPWDLP
jgi:hypothetical protein